MIPRSIILAIQFLTRLPTPRIDPPGQSELGDTARWFPFVGFLIGVVVALTFVALSQVSPWVGALAGVIAWVWVTGGLHLDGLADVADAFGAAHRDKVRFLEVLADPHVGSFGVLTIVLQLLAKLVLLSELALLSASAGAGGWRSVAVLMLVAAWARWGALVWSLYVPPLKAGLGQTFSTGTGRAVMMVWGGGLLVVSALIAPALLVAPVLAALTVVYWRRSIGGITGDCMGASVEVMETLCLLAVVIVYRM